MDYAAHVSHGEFGNEMSSLSGIAICVSEMKSRIFANPPPPREFSVKRKRAHGRTCRNFNRETFSQPPPLIQLLLMLTISFACVAYKISVFYWIPLFVACHFAFSAVYISGACDVSLSLLLPACKLALRVTMRKQYKSTFSAPLVVNGFTETSDNRLTDFAEAAWNKSTNTGNDQKFMTRGPQLVSRVERSTYSLTRENS